MCVRRHAEGKEAFAAAAARARVRQRMEQEQQELRRTGGGAGAAPEQEHRVKPEQESHCQCHETDAEICSAVASNGQAAVAEVQVARVPPVGSVVSAGAGGSAPAGAPAGAGSGSAGPAAASCEPGSVLPSGRGSRGPQPEVRLAPDPDPAPRLASHNSSSPTVMQHRTGTTTAEHHDGSNGKGLRHPAAASVRRAGPPASPAEAKLPADVGQGLEQLRDRIKAAGRTRTHEHRNPVHHPDILARATAHFRTFLIGVNHLLEACRQSHYFGVLSRTTQPAHIGAFLGVALVAIILFPATTHQSHQRHGHVLPSHGSAGPSPWTSLAYVVAFAAHFGSQFWMTFVSGLSLFFSLPRHHFAEVQKVLFPLYFAINSGLSLVTLATFLRLTQAPTGSWEWDLQGGVQVATMVFCFLLELLVRLYLTPPLLKLITAKTEIEKSVEGVGEEVGRYNLGPLAQCPHYLKIHGDFRRVHTSIALANIVSMGCTAFHAHYLASKLCL